MAARPQLSDEHVAVILDNYLTWAKEHRAPATYRWYHDYLQAHVTSHPNLLVSDLKPNQVEQWASRGKSKRAKITAMKAALNWAERMGYIVSSPIRSLDRPEAPRRDEFVTANDLQLVLARTDHCFGDLVRFAWLTGARPQECA